jgi:hypothetical protein
MQCSAPSEKRQKEHGPSRNKGRRRGDYRENTVISQEAKAVRIKRMDPMCNALLLRPNHFY